MGMFDYVRFKIDCPNCGKLLDDFQSKSGPCDLRIIKAHKLPEFYDYCFDGCNAMTIFNKNWNKKKWTRTTRTAGLDGKWQYGLDKKYSKRQIKEIVNASPRPNTN